MCSPVELLSSLQKSFSRKGTLAFFLHDDSGQDLVEYGLIAGLIGLAAVTSTHGVAVSVQGAINFVSSRLALSIP